ncbi:MAG: hypothetical protein ACYDH5_17015 [Acidimicrobiales bacterium]
MALLSAVMVIAIASTIAISAVALSLHNENAAGLQTRQVQAIDGAEAGLNLAYQTIQTTPYASLPTQPWTGTVGISPGQVNYSVSVSFYSDYPPTSGALMTGSSGTPQAAVIFSTGTPASGLYGPRTLQSEVRLSPATSAATFDKAIFGDSSVSLGSKFQLLSHTPGSTAVYTNSMGSPGNSSAISCNGGGDGGDGGAQSIQGSLESYQGGITMQNCNVISDVRSGGTVSMQASQVAGNVTSSSTSSSAIKLSGQSMVRNAEAGGGIQLSGGSRVSGTVSADVKPAPAPPTHEAFPQLSYSASSASAWQSAGFTTNHFTSCSAAEAQLATWYGPGGSPPAGPELVHVASTCTLNLQGHGDGGLTVQLPRSLAIVADGPIQVSGQLTIESASSASHSLYLITPYLDPSSGITPTCGGDGGGGISFGSNTTLGTSSHPLATFVYTPCQVKTSGDGAFKATGQIYSGSTVSMGSGSQLTFQPFPAIPGEPLPAAGRQYDLNIAFERECPSPSAAACQVP